MISPEAHIALADFFFICSNIINFHQSIYKKMIKDCSFLKGYVKIAMS
jgi:hypothetical protein